MHVSLPAILLWRYSGFSLFISGELVRGELIKACLQVAHAGFYRSERRREGGGRRNHTQREEKGNCCRSYDDKQILFSITHSQSQRSFGIGMNKGWSKEEKETEEGKERERKTGHNHSNLLNKGFLCLVSMKGTWTDLVILQEGKDQSALGWIWDQ